MARRSNKLTIHVLPARTSESITFRCSGHFGKLLLTIPSTRLAQETLSPGTDKKAYWNDVIVKVQAAILSM